MKKLVFLFVLSVVIIIVDQWSKYVVSGSFYVGESIPVIDGFFNFTYVRNSGAAFGFGGQFDNWIRYSLFLGLPVVACIWLVYLIIKSVQGPFLLSLAYSLILGGAIGNLIDRFRLDYVVDFFDFYYGKSHFATFNVADAAISVAAGLLIIDFFIQRKEEKEATGELPSTSE
jgi:signal peptidase II